MRLAGYASLFGAPDLIGDVVRRGAFRASLADGAARPLLVRHDPRLRAGVWRRLWEDSRGLWVEGELLPEAPAADLARRLIARGVDGLSIGYVTRASAPLPKGRALIEVDLIEVSLVETPMLPAARLARADVPALAA